MTSGSGENQHLLWRTDHLFCVRTSRIASSRGSPCGFAATVRAAPCAPHGTHMRHAPAKRHVHASRAASTRSSVYAGFHQFLPWFTYRLWRDDGMGKAALSARTYCASAGHAFGMDQRCRRSGRRRRGMLNNAIAYTSAVAQTALRLPPRGMHLAAPVSRVVAMPATFLLAWLPLLHTRLLRAALIT